MQDAQDSLQPIASPYPPFRYAVLVIAILMVVTMLGQLDRNLPSLLVAPMREAFDITDTQFSLFGGASFSLFYALLGPVFGGLVDRKHRPMLLIGGVLGWSLMTGLTAFTTSYWQILICRAGVGIGEAVLAPACYSLIADYVEPRRRGRALAIYVIAIMAGGGASLILGGALIEALSGASALFGGMEPWRIVFLTVALPGPIAALLLLFVREVPRQEQGHSAAVADPEEFRRYLSANRATFGFLIAGQVALGLINNSIFPWMPSFFERSHGVEPHSAGLVLGSLMIGAGTVGLLIGGWLSDHWANTGAKGARLRPMFVAAAIQIPALIVFPLIPSLTLSYAAIGLLFLGTSVTLAATPSMYQAVTPNRMRGRVVTLSLLASGLIGWTLGPSATAFITDYVFRDDAALRYAILCVSMPSGLLFLFCSWRAFAPFVATNESLFGASQADEAILDSDPAGTSPLVEAAAPAR
ncbi:MFS transporter [Sphingopyxis panaciterrulae]|uniref:MFS family permease n=1 Tax=Sphingopyxis panaciterrulae TaxID=462372 RepID=A0A7W9ERZ4_9SPHN|nr:MFS transporter [Sphingopyxis panaciterrulae]MBB5708134.1 MFS family permease [Sphingopyxis panaciterrulae]